MVSASSVTNERPRNRVITAISWLFLALAVAALITACVLAVTFPASYLKTVSDVYGFAEETPAKLPPSFRYIAYERVVLYVAAAMSLMGAFLIKELWLPRKVLTVAMNLAAIVAAGLIIYALLMPMLVEIEQL